VWLGKQWRLKKVQESKDSALTKKDFILLLFTLKWYGYSVIKNEETSRSGHDQPVQEEEVYCYFKSTDGHKGTWNFSQKRLNLSFLEESCRIGGCLLVDASKTKLMPDSFSRTIPIWCAVLNHLVATACPSDSKECKGKSGKDLKSNDATRWRGAFFTPESCVSREEHQHIQTNVLPNLVSAIQNSGAIDIKWLCSTLRKPLRPYWITPASFRAETAHPAQIDEDNYFCILCVNASDPKLRGKELKVRLPSSDKELDFVYTPGAADDEESWSRKLVPAVFWKNIQQILDRSEQESVNFEDCVDRSIGSIMQKRKWKDVDIHNDAESDCDGDQPSPLVGTLSPSLYTAIGESGLFVGSRRAGRPPECWNTFDAVVNVSMLEYDSIVSGDLPKEKYYLQLPVEEGKRDRTNLERWMAVALVFVLVHLQQRRKILVHCAQGKDRSVAVIVAAVASFCEISNNSLLLASWCSSVNTQDFLNIVDSDLRNEEQGHAPSLYKHSGLESRLVELLLGREGRDRFMSSISSYRAEQMSPAKTEKEEVFTKSHLRLALNFVQRHHVKADPSRNTMQKVNRFFLSSSFTE
jgi:tRNA A64-2'-O-ribosylphosphate transferase